MTQRYYSIDVAAVRTGVPASTIRRWISEGKLHSLLTNGRRYVTLQGAADARDAPIKTRLLRTARK